MTHYFDVISCGLKQMHAQFSFFFGLHNAIVFLSKLFWINKIKDFEDNLPCSRRSDSRARR